MNVNTSVCVHKTCFKAINKWTTVTVKRLQRAARPQDVIMTVQTCPGKTHSGRRPAKFVSGGWRTLRRVLTAVVSVFAPRSWDVLQTEKKVLTLTLFGKSASESVNQTVFLYVISRFRRLQLMEKILYDFASRVFLSDFLSRFSRLFVRIVQKSRYMKGTIIIV